jgi:hypothetical protein
MYVLRCVSSLTIIEQSIGNRNRISDTWTVEARVAVDDDEEIGVGSADARSIEAEVPLKRRRALSDQVYARLSHQIRARPEGELKQWCTGRQRRASAISHRGPSIFAGEFSL